MSKRFTDTEKYKKTFFRALQGPYKLLWDYLYHDCDHAGIWHVDEEIAQIYIGKDMPINLDKALEYFNEGEERIVVLDGGTKWFMRSFIDFQYGYLNPENRVHKSIITILEKHKIKGLKGPLQGAKDKDKDKDMDKDKDKDKDMDKDKDKDKDMDKDKDKDKDKEQHEISFEEFWEVYPRRGGKKIGKATAREKFFKLKASDLASVIIAVHNYAESKTAQDGYARDPERFFVKNYWKEWIEPEEVVEDTGDGKGLSKVQEFIRRGK